jgi:hypothetical protein
MNVYEIYNQEYITARHEYVFQIDEVFNFTTKDKTKFYYIYEDGKKVFSTSAHQTWYKYIKQIKKLGELLINKSMEEE